MNREPIGLYIFRFMMGFGLFAFMMMLYWSSELIEKDLKHLRSDITELRTELRGIRKETQRLQASGLRKVSERSSPAEIAQAERPHIDPSIVNILSRDSFTDEILPTLLPEDFVPTGVRHAATIGRPDNLHPFSNYSGVGDWLRMCSVTVATNEFGKFETYAPAAAIKIEQRTDDEFWVHLRDDIYWQPLRADHFPEDVTLHPDFLKRHQVTAHDFKFYWDAVMNPHFQEPGAVSLRNYLGDIEEMRVIDDQTLAVRWRKEMADGKERIKYIAKGWTGSLRPLARWVYQYFPDGSKIIEDDDDPDTYRTNSVWAQNFTLHWAKNVIVSCGPWTFDGMTDRKIAFKRNDDFYSPLDVLVEAFEIEIKDSPEGIWQEFKAGKLDTYGLRPDQLIELDNFLASSEYLEQKENNNGIQRVDYVRRAYNYIGWNQATPFFESARVRQAMTMAIDRNRIIEQNLNGMGIPITGPFYRYSPSYNAGIEPLPFDPQRARQILEEEGWYDAAGTGVREKMVDGVSIPFRFKLTYYVKNPTSKAVSDYVATALREIGVDCELHGVDIADLSAVFDDKGFDALYMGWALGSPPEEPRQLWHSQGAREKGSSNAVGFANEEADQIIERLQYEYDHEDRVKLYHRFHQIMHDEQPYTFLYTPKTVFLHRDYVQNVFIPAERQDLIPGANVAEPSSSIFWLKRAES